MKAVTIFLSVVMIGLVALALSAVGLFAVVHLVETFGKRMEVLGGLILIGIGIQVIITHLYPG